MFFFNKKKDLDLNIILNCILVNENVRPAMLVQPMDYKETTHTDSTTKSIIEEIKKLFPHLILSTDYNIYQGVIISKTDYNGKNISLNEMGRILGYPCYRDFNNIDNDKITYAISIYVKDNNNNKIEIFSNICKNETNIQEFNILANKAKIAFAKRDYKEILNESKVKEIYVESLPIVPTQIIINKLLKNEKLEKTEIDQVQNILFNFGFSMKSKFNFQYNNSIHRGILLGLLLNEKYNTLSPFFPLQHYPEQSKEVNEIIKGWEKGLLDIVEKTTIEHREKLKREAGKQTKKTKRIYILLSNRKTRSSKNKTQKIK